MTTDFADHDLKDGENLNLAAERSQHHVEWTQEYFGVSSRYHIEAIELLAKVRIAQARFDDAVALLKHSCKLRAGLLGKDHPSIARLNREIDAATSDGAKLK